MALTFDEYWPLWPQETEGHLLVDVCIKGELSELVQLLWSPDSSFVAEANSQRNFLNVQCTDWVESETELPDLPGGFDWAYERSASKSVVTDIQGKLRKVRFESKGTVLAPQGFKTEELQRCTLFENGGRVVVDACVNSTAPFCENIRVICRYTVEELGSHRCQFSVSYHVVYLQSINMLLKSVLEKGVEDGLTSNYNIFRRTLSTYVSFASGEGSIVAAATADEDLETFTPPTYDLHLYQSAINWKRFPPASLLIAALDKDEHSSTLSAAWLSIKKIVKAVVFCIMLVSAFNLISWMAEAVSVRMHMSSFLPQMEFFECVLTAIVVLLIVEATQLSLYIGGRLLDQIRMGTIRLLNYINRWQLRPFFGKRCSFPSRSALEREPSVIRNTMSKRSVVETEGLMSMNIGDEPEESSLFRRLNDGFWTLLDYSGMDFPKFTQSLPIEKRINPDGSIVEEVFENERLQPFRGWGHSWPGHFLPTDRFKHWSSFDTNGDLVTCDDFDSVEPKLIHGWEWREKGWQVDLSGVKTDAVDSQGWYYSLDFPWIKFTPEKNSGVKGISDFVRRRRWTRTRVQQSADSREEFAKDIDFLTSDSTPYFDSRNFL